MKPGETYRDPRPTPVGGEFARLREARRQLALRFEFGMPPEPLTVKPLWKRAIEQRTREDSK